MDAPMATKIGCKSRLAVLQRPLKYYLLLLQRQLRTLGLRKYPHLIAILIFLLPLCAMYGCNKLGKSTASVAAEGVPVLVTKVVTKDVPVYISALGSVTPIYTVTVKTQIDGQLLQVYIDDGQMVKAGDLLAEVDPRPYQALLIQYQGQLLRDKALLANAKVDLERYKVLFEQDSISEQTLATQRSLVAQYEGAVKTDLGQIDTAILDINYCKIVSPMDGRAGIVSVNPGNIVQTTDTTGIVVINTINPIYVLFSITEDDIPEVASKFATGATIIVEAHDRSQSKLLATGVLYAIDNQIDTSTGTVRLEAIFNNEDSLLFANQFVNIQLLINTLQNAMVVPTTAIVYGVKGTFVYVLNKDKTVSMQQVKIIGSMGDLTAVSGDIHPGQKVISEGTDQLKEGTAVKVLSTPMAEGKVNNEPV